ncbi:hypothetical protein [Streptomyces enissocaesilis]|uniref:Uncharacterized protein n=1 Tax=Streptomyces enissocaesilis TaxID=332589 RepID=A0ABP6JZ66_9ACTN
MDTLPGLPQSSGITRLVHPEAGEPRPAYEALELPAADDQRLLAHLPADDSTSAALDRLTAAGPGGTARGPGPTRTARDRSGGSAVRGRPTAAGGVEHRRRLRPSAVRTDRTPGAGADPGAGPSGQETPQLDADQKRLARWSRWVWSPWPG